MGASWVVREHRITYMRPAMEGDRLVARTWVATFEKVSSVRRYRIVREGDGAVLAEGETNWIFVDAASGRPRRIPSEIASLFTLHSSSMP
jgi:acyl-CoA thioester hydrolase